MITNCCREYDWTFYALRSQRKINFVCRRKASISAKSIRKEVCSHDNNRFAKEKKNILFKMGIGTCLRACYLNSISFNIFLLLAAPEKIFLHDFPPLDYWCHFAHHDDDKGATMKFYIKRFSIEFIFVAFKSLP
jgi:hypothetical protein